MFFRKKKKRIFTKIIVLILLLAVLLLVYGYYRVKNMSPEEILKSGFVHQIVEKKIGKSAGNLFSVAPHFLGFTEPRTYLLLFLNNTEMRPGGGFIGSYAVLKMEQGNINLIKLEGTETLDAGAPDDWVVEPPQPIKSELSVDRWYFRDSNWSADFAIDAKRALEFYKAEGGVDADEIDTVVAITPTVLEEVLKILGPVKLQGIEFTAENVIETLEYEVEYGYEDKGIRFEQRKQIMKPFFLEMVSQLKYDMLGNVNSYWDMVQKMASEKHILIYSKDDKIMGIVEENGWAGRVKDDEGGDFLMWVDANLGALKTDHAIERTLHYTITKDGEKYLARAQMQYSHIGEYDWRTSRYKSFARAYAPVGSDFESVKIINEGEVVPAEIGVGDEFGKKSFMTTIIVEPGEKKSLVYTYYLADDVVKDIENGWYNLFVQKQLGSKDYNLTVELDFDKTIVDADPNASVSSDKKIYYYETDLNLDRSIKIEFEK